MSKKPNHTLLKQFHAFIIGYLNNGNDHYGNAMKPTYPSSLASNVFIEL